MGRRIYSDEREAVRELLRRIRVDVGLTQVQLSEKLERPQSYVSDYERGHRRLDWVAVDEVLLACNFSLIKFSQNYIAMVRP